MAGGAVTEATLVELVKTMSALESGQRDVLAELRALRSIFERTALANDAESEDESESETPATSSTTGDQAPKPNGMMGTLMSKLEKRLEAKLGSLDDVAMEAMFRKLEGQI